MAKQTPGNDNAQSATAQRFVDSVVSISQDSPAADDIVFMQAGLCHVFFPYQDPGNDVDFWVRKHGNYVLTMQATSEYNPQTEAAEKFGLPFGAKPRMMLALLNTIALKQKTPELHLGNSLTDFIGHYLGFDTNGRTIRDVKNQLARLASADIKLTYNLGEDKNGHHTARTRMNIIRDLDIWWPKDKNQRHLWGNFLRFSQDYFEALQAHGVPLDLRALRALSNKPMALDLYSFMAHRLHWLSKPTPITWQAVKGQFGHTYARMNDFKKDFRRNLILVKQLYPEARFEEIENKGIVLYPSKPAVPGKVQLIVPPQAQLTNPFAQTPKRRKGRTPTKTEEAQIKLELAALWNKDQADKKPDTGTS